MKCINNNPMLLLTLSSLKNAYIEAMACNEKIDPHSVGCDIRAIVGVLQGDEAVKDMDLTIAARKTNIHDIKINALEYENKRLRNEIYELKKELNSHTANEDKKEGGGG